MRCAFGASTCVRAAAPMPLPHNGSHHAHDGSHRAYHAHNGTHHRLVWPPVMQLPVGTHAVEDWMANVTAQTCDQAPQLEEHVHSVGLLAAIVSGGNRPVKNTTYTNQRCYCNRHGVHYLYILHHFAHSLGVYWNKFFAIMRGLETIPYGTWMLWLDPDIVVTNQEESPHRWVARHIRASSEFIGQPKQRCDVMAGYGLNAGGIMLRKSCWTMRFVRYWWSINAMCAGRPLYDNGPFIVTVNQVLLGFLNLDVPNGTKPKLKSDCGALLAPSNAPGGQIKAWNTKHPSRVCISNKGFNPMANIGPTAMDFGDHLENWVPGDWFLHFPGSSRPSHVPYKRCFEAFERAVDPGALQRPAETRYASPDICRSQRGITQHAPRDSVPNCTRYMYPKMVHDVRNLTETPWVRWARRTGIAATAAESDEDAL